MALPTTWRPLRVPLAALAGSAALMGAMSGMLIGLWALDARAAVEEDPLPDLVLQDLLLGRLDAGESGRALRFLSQLHPDHSIRAWAQQELDALAPPEPTSVVLRVPVPAPVQSDEPAPAEGGEGEAVEAAAPPAPVAAAPKAPKKAAPAAEKPALKKASPAAKKPSPKPVAAMKASPKPVASKEDPQSTEEASGPDPLAPKDPVPAVAKPEHAKAFQASTWLPRPDLAPDAAQVGAAKALAHRPAPSAPEGTDEAPAAEAAGGQPDTAPLPSPAPEPEPEPVPAPPPPPEPVPVVSVGGLSLSDGFLASEEVVLTLAGLEEQVERCWASALTANPDPDLGGEVTIRFRVHDGRPALVKALDDDSGTPSFVPCVGRHIRKAQFGSEARGIVEWTLLVENAA